MLIFLGIVIWIQSPVKVLDNQENMIHSDATEPINEKDNIFVYYTTPAPKEEIVENIQKPTPKYKTMTKPAPKAKIVEKTRFRCDGRIYCSQMRSCAEAKSFLRNCPGTRMDGDSDGIPCESQHCGRR